jgi:hypothetical protein
LTIEAKVVGCPGLQSITGMTLAAIMAGLFSIMWSTGAGSEVMQRIAVPMIGGMGLSTLLTLVVIPAIYGWRLPAKTLEWSRQLETMEHLISLVGDEGSGAERSSMKPGSVCRFAKLFGRWSAATPICCR